MDEDADRLYERAKGLLADGSDAARTAAIDLLAAAAEAGHARSAWRLGEMLAEREPARAAALLRGAAEAGHARAAFLLGLMLAQGRPGLAADPAAAAQWCRRAAEAGLAEAQFNLGLLHAAGSGVPVDGDCAARWLRLAAINGVSEAEGCLEVLYGDRERPRTWDEAETRASVALARTDPDAPKTLRFAEYYLDPCLDLLAQRMRLERDELEDIVQEFFCELEQPLERGALRGQAWKAALRTHYQADRGAFRPYLGRTLVNFAREWLRRRARAQDGAAAAPAPIRPAEEVERHADHWRALLARFQGSIPADRADALRAAAVLVAVLAEGTPHAELAQRLGRSERTVRSDLRLGGELLAEWLGAAFAPLPGDDAVAAALREGLALLPAWLHRIGADKRTRCLLYLALAERRLVP